MKTSGLFTLLAAALHNLPQAHAFSLVPSAIHRAQLSKSTVPFKHHATKELTDYSGERGAFISVFALENIPLSVDEFWSGFDDYLSVQKCFSGHGETWLELGGASPSTVRVPRSHL